MSGGHSSAAPKGPIARVIQAVALLVAVGLTYGATRALPEVNSSVAVIAAVGLLLLAGTLLSELLEPIGLPHLSAYLFAGILAGPYVLHLVDHDTVNRLSPINTLALALIALAGGAELKADLLRRTAKSLGYATLTQAVIVLVVSTAVFIACAPYVPFARELPFGPLFGLALLWGILSVTRSPSACLGILAQTRAKGPIAEFSLAFIMASDVVVVVMLAIGMMIARPLILPGAEFSADAFSALGHEIFGSIALGTTLGVVLAAYIRLVGRQLLLVLLALGFGFTEALRYIHFDPLLTFLSAGFFVQNFSQQGGKLLTAVERAGGIVYVVFFATAGAHLALPLLADMWPVALTLAGARALATWGAARAGSRLARDIPSVKKWGWSSLVSQAGLALGVATMIQRTFPSVGEGFAALAVAMVAINECVGPVLFKFALDKSGESRTDEAPRVDSDFNEEEPPQVAAPEPAGPDTA